jgi:hypothetical protein
MQTTQDVVEQTDGNAIIAKKLAELQNLRNRAVHDMTSLQQSIEMQRMQLAAIEAQITLLQDLEFTMIETCTCHRIKDGDKVGSDVVRHITVDGEVCDVKRVKARDYAVFTHHGRMKPGDAIVKLLKTRPGLRMREILDKLEFEVASAARDTRHSLRSTILNLSKAGRVERLEDGSYRIADDP